MIYRVFKAESETARHGADAGTQTRAPRARVLAQLGVTAALQALLLVSSVGIASAQAQSGSDNAPPNPAQNAHHLFLQNPHNGRAEAPDVPQRDGHMSAADRKLLRQHIEDAARDMYKRQP